MMAQPTYLLCGYHLPTASDPQCLLYDDSKGTFKVKVLKSGKEGGSLRNAFKDDAPPFGFTRVYDNVYTGGIRRAPQGRCLLPEELPHTVLSERDIDGIFRTIGSIKQGVREGIPLWTSMTEKEFVLETIFKKDFLRKVRVALVEALGLVQDRQGGYIPSKLETLFIGFHPIDFCAGYRVYSDGPDDIVIRHKIIKYVLEEACPYIKVALFDSLGLEKALSVCLPTGSTGKAVEIFRPREAVDVCYVVADNKLAVDGVDFSLVTSDLADRPNQVHVCPMPEGLSYWDWRTVETDEDGPTRAKRARPAETKPDEFYHDIEGQLSLLGSVYKVGETDDFFSKGAVVFKTHDRDSRFACLDFSNFYANVVIKFNLDDYVAEVLKRMTVLRWRYKEIKSWIVAVIGKAKHYDVALFNRVKTLSVAVVLSTINANAGVVTGASTDGLFVDPDAVGCFRYPDGFPIKLEFAPSKTAPMVSDSPHVYAGISAETGKVVHRGFIGRMPGKHPEWYRDLVSTVVEGCLGVIDDPITRIESILYSKGAATRQYVLPNTMVTPQPTVCKLQAVEYYCNNLCVGICQVYSVVDDHILPGWALTGGGHVPPATISALCVKQIDVQKYVSTIEDKIRRVATTFKDRVEAVSLCETAFDVIKKHIIKTLPSARAVYPGGVDYS